MVLLRPNFFDSHRDVPAQTGLGGESLGYASSLSRLFEWVGWTAAMRLRRLGDVGSGFGRATMAAGLLKQIVFGGGGASSALTSFRDSLAWKGITGLHDQKAA